MRGDRETKKETEIGRDRDITGRDRQAVIETQTDSWQRQRQTE